MMRKVAFYFFLLLGFLLPGLGFAASTFVITSDTLVKDTTTSRYSPMLIRVIEATATDDTAAADPSILLSSSLSGVTQPLESWWLYKVCIDGNHAGTEPTDNSDFTLTEDSFDLLEGLGTNAVDSDATNCFNPTPAPFTEAWTGIITNNSADGAVIYFRFILYQEKLR